MQKKSEGITLDDMLGYKQTIINYGLGEIIDSVTRRCKEEGATLQYIWDSTFTLFENMLNVLSSELREKDREMVQNEEEINGVYLQNIAHLKKKNSELEKHL